MELVPASKKRRLTVALQNVHRLRNTGELHAERR